MIEESQMALTDAEAADIMTECIGSIDWQSEFIANPDKDAVDPLAFIDAITPKRPATIRLIEQMIAGQHPLIVLTAATDMTPRVILLATTVRSVIQILADRGFGGEARQIVSALERNDAIAAATATT